MAGFDEMIYGERANGAGQKRRGFLGPLTDINGNTMTEFSINVDGEEMPSIIPTLHPAELSYILFGGDVPESAIPKIVQHANRRKAQGKGPFWEPGKD